MALAVALGVATPRGARAEDGETPQYHALLNEAVSEYDARRYEEARALFRRANDLSPNARTLRGIGMASFELREYVEALRALEGALVETRRPLTASQRQQVEGLLERTRAFVGHFMLRLTPKETVLNVDGAPVTMEADGALLLSFGRHAVTAEAKGYVLDSRELNVIGGEREELTFHLRPVATTLEPPAAIAPSGRTDPGAHPPGWVEGGPESHASSTGWFVAAALTAAGAVGGVVYWLDRNSAISKCRNASAAGSICVNSDTLSVERNVSIGAAAALTVGTVALVTVGAVIHSRNHKPDPGPILACSPGPGMVNCALQIAF